ncbi:MarR family winged helix-turn-helix transcriptional regulator [Geodermatophilus poikilotrophus]|uniref:DNA-binding transcriptional regulator, MarR family n=1 Tax=Geodermatophilus poikilotrophus TaxID=1333667 RepID=A0A1I0E5N2_9ACTN|nr:MarR family transcriptional regulator [Geodermatophilus poikilotrophus]SET40218.1 DNA-binding transcriptional regulator, MarR family [Geodermatophilus poikilotrophus]
MSVCDEVRQDGDPRDHGGQGRQNLALLCFYPHRAMEARLLATLAAEGFDDLTIAQGRIAARIGPGGTRLTDLAAQALVTKQTANHLVDQLERAGYVRRVPDPTDGRARLVQIAGRGQAVVALARRVEAEVEAEWTAHLGEEVTAQLRAALERLREITDPYR